MLERSSSSSWAGWLALVGTAFVLVFAPLYPGRITLAGIPLDTVILTVPIAILFGIPLLARIGPEGFPRIGIELPAIVFLGWALLSAVFTGAQASVIATWVRYASYLMLVCVVAAVAVDPARRRMMLWILVIVGSVTVVHGFWQYVNPTVYIGMDGLDTSVATRVFATFENPNFYAEFLVLVFAVTLALVFAEKGVLRYIAIVLLVAQAMALLLTYTRGSWLALALGLGIVVLMIDARLIWPFVLSGAAIVPFVPGVLDRVASIFSLEGTASFRLKLWEVAGESIAERPLFGAGLGRFYDAFRATVLSHPEITLGYLSYGAHNSYFQLAAEVGILGGIAFAWMVFGSCRMGAFYNMRMAGDMRSRLVNAALTAGLVAFAVNAFTSNAFQHPRGAVFFFVLVGIQAGVGAEFWSSPAVARVRVRKAGTAWATSYAARVYGSIEGVVGAMLHTSVTRWLLAHEPIGGGRLLATSRVARVVIGEGSAGRGEALPGDG
ncbi:MAG: O-antigen ligase family protein [Actinomycetota bacterium]|nr:MAG: O-antigen [Actinomycetota bacterium]MDO8948910.1 O-antigen ligase family protein [Actinomycetota bacterium]MDP3629818.1 O-antigen ligase family protein [Actinomycetota bacterium]